MKSPYPSATYEMVEVSATGIDDALRFIAGHLMRRQHQGWTLGDARALVEGWRNEYDFRKDGQLLTLQFDLRKARGMDDHVTFTLATMSLCVRGEVKANLAKALLANRRLRGEPESLTPVGIAVGIVLGLLVLWGLLAVATRSH